jgi:hypothetical protein
MSEIEQVLDPGFDDPTKWPSHIAVSVTGSQLIIQPGYSFSFGQIPALAAEIGATYAWELDVAQISPIGNYIILFGGTSIWSSPAISGVYSGTFEATTTGALTFFFLVGMNQPAIFNSISIKRVVPGPPPDVIPFNLQINQGKSETVSVSRAAQAQLYIDQGRSYNGHIDQQHDAVAYVATNPQFNPEL